MRRLAPHVVRWVLQMQQPPAAQDGQLLSDDAIPPTLAPVLQRIMREQLPVLADSARALREWIAAHPGERVPRAIGSHDFELEGQRGTRLVRPYSLCMLQRARDRYLRLSGAERAAADRLLAEARGEAFMDFCDPPRLARDGMSVRLAQPA
jgi:hypothetical protein